MNIVKIASVAGLLLGMAIVPAQAQSQEASSMETGQSRAQQLMGDIAPKLAELTDDVLFGDVWERPGLAKRDRSLITVAALIALNRPEQLRSHMRLARQNGVAEAELVETITQLAFYSGWPNAIAAVGVAREVFAENDAQKGKPPSSTNDAVVVTKAGSQPSVAGAAANFTGAVRVDMRFQRPLPARTGGGIVTFEPGARTAWHSHPIGQTLIVTEGRGLVQHWGGPVQPIGIGDLVWIPPGVKHWHGASATDSMVHVAIAEAQDGQSVTWMEQVDNAQYRGSDR
ncbi:MAG: (R)-mandelonitrile lyase [Ferrovibrionaceae bacterium]